MGRGGSLSFFFFSSAEDFLAQRCAVRWLFLLFLRRFLGLLLLVAGVAGLLPAVEPYPSFIVVPFFSHPPFLSLVFSYGRDVRCVFVQNFGQSGRGLLAAGPPFFPWSSACFSPFFRACSDLRPLPLSERQREFYSCSRPALLLLLPTMFGSFPPDGWTVFPGSRRASALSFFFFFKGLRVDPLSPSFKTRDLS